MRSVLITDAGTIVLITAGTMYKAIYRCTAGAQCSNYDAGTMVLKALITDAVR